MFSNTWNPGVARYSWMTPYHVVAPSVRVGVADERLQTQFFHRIKRHPHLFPGAVVLGRQRVLDDHRIFRLDTGNLKQLRELSRGERGGLPKPVQASVTNVVDSPFVLTGPDKPLAGVFVGSEQEVREARDAVSHRVIDIADRAIAG